MLKEIQVRELSRKLKVAEARLADRARSLAPRHGFLEEAEAANRRVATETDENPGSSLPTASTLPNSDGDVVAAAHGETRAPGSVQPARAAADGMLPPIDLGMTSGMDGNNGGGAGSGAIFRELAVARAENSALQKELAKQGERVRAAEGEAAATSEKFAAAMGAKVECAI